MSESKVAVLTPYFYHVAPLKNVFKSSKYPTYLF
jgi:hypothetical protein